MPHTAASFGGGPYFVNSKSGSPIKNNGGTAFYGGTLAANSPMTVSIGTSTMGFRAGVSDNKGALLNDQKVGSTSQPYSAGTFNSMVASQYIMFGYSSKVAGQTNTIIQIGGSMGLKVSQAYAGRFIRTNHYVLTAVNGESSAWDYVTGKPRTNPTVMSTDTVNAEAYKGTMAIPGRLFYLSTGKDVTSVSYSPKTD